MRSNSRAGWVVLVLLVAGGVIWLHCVFADTVDLSRPFTCSDVSPTPMRISANGLVMGGVAYPLEDPNASSLPNLTNTIFGSNDGLSEIDVQQRDGGEVNVSYMKFWVNPYQGGGDPDKYKIFEKASYIVESPPAYFHSQGRGCKN